MATLGGEQPFLACQSSETLPSDVSLLCAGELGAKQLISSQQCEFRTTQTSPLFLLG